MMIRSVSAGEYAPPPAEAPDTTEIWGTTSGQRHRLTEDPPVAGQRRRALLHPRAARLDEAHHRDPRPRRRLEHPDDRVGVALPERAAEVRAVLGIAGDRAAGHAPGGAERRRHRGPRARRAAARRPASAAAWTLPESHSASSRSSGLEPPGGLARRWRS